MNQPPITFNLEPLEKKRSWYRRPLVWVGIVLVLLVGGGVFYFGLFYSTIIVENGSWLKSLVNAVSGKETTPIVEEAKDPNPMPSPEPDRFDVLILGIRGENAVAEEGGLLTDTMLLASIDKKTNEVALISIPRDLYLDMPTYLQDGTEINFRGKINEVYERGLSHKQGLSYASSVVSKVTGVYVDKAVLFDFDAFQKIVDNLGGVDITLAQPFKESAQWGFEFSLPAGPNHLSGEQALYYSRSRFSSSDFDRARRQQEVILAIKNKALSLGLANPLKITSLLSDLKGDVRTDIQPWEIGKLLNLGRVASGSGKIIRYVITSENLLYESRLENGSFILLPRGETFDLIREHLQSIFDPTQKERGPSEDYSSSFGDPLSSSFTARSSISPARTASLIASRLASLS